MLIRDADPGRDGAGCAGIYAPYVTDSVISFEEVAPTAAEFESRIARVTATHPWLIAETDDGRVAGYAYATAHRDRAAYRWAADVAVYVGLEHRRQGVGSRLYTELLALLPRQHISTAIAGITLPNEASVGLHERFGFAPVGVYERIGWKAGAWRDVGWWQLQLLAPTEGKPPEPGPPARLGTVVR